MSDRNSYFTLGTALLVVAMGVAAVNGNLYNAAVAGFRPYSFWTAPLMWVAYFLFVFGLALFVFGLARVPLPPWKKTHFPDLDIDVPGSFARVQDKSAQPDIWLGFRIRVTNLETDQVASIQFQYRAKLDWKWPRGREFGETFFFESTDDPPLGVPTDNVLAQPLNILPQHSVSGYYVVHLNAAWAAMRAVPSDESLLVEDHASRQAVVIPVSGPLRRFGPANWAPAKKDKTGNWTVYPPDPGFRDSPEDYPVVHSPDPTAANPPPETPAPEVPTRE